MSDCCYRDVVVYCVIVVDVDVMLLMLFVVMLFVVCLVFGVYGLSVPYWKTGVNREEHGEKVSVWLGKVGADSEISTKASIQTTFARQMNHKCCCHG